MRRHTRVDTATITHLSDAWDSVHKAAESADYVLAQPTFETNGENRWNAVTPDSLCWPYGLWLHENLLAVADSGNNRVMIWRRP